MSAWAHAHGKPEQGGVIRHLPEDFKVYEQLNIPFSGDGEHVWLRIKKSCQNTETVARALARLAKVPARDVSWSGNKDFRAVCEQWFSVRVLPQAEPDWTTLDVDGVSVVEVERHKRKLKRGTHRANRFQIRVRQLQNTGAELETRLQQVSEQGIPNYFGPQRFGREADNMTQALAMFAGEQNVSSRIHRGRLLSAARSWLFNCVLSERVADGSWTKLHIGEPANLDGSASTFVATGDAEEQFRLAEQDIHPTAPLWGESPPDVVDGETAIFAMERNCIEQFQQLRMGLEQNKLRYARRACRARVLDLQWQLADNQLELEFELYRGQFATSVLRELVNL